MQSLAVPSAYHQPPRELVYYDYLFVVDDIVTVALHDVVGADSLVDMVLNLHVFYIRKVLDFVKTLRLCNAAVGKPYRLFLFVNAVIARLRRLVLVVGIRRFKRLRKTVGGEVLVARLAALTRYNKRRPRLIDKNTVNLVDYREP